MKPRKWPRPEDSPLERRSQIARSYRAALAEIAPDRCAVLDRAAEALGENWIVPPMVVSDDSLMTLTAAAEALGVKRGTLWAWADRGIVPRETDGRFDLAAVRVALADRSTRRRAS